MGLSEKYAKEVASELYYELHSPELYLFDPATIALIVQILYILYQLFMKWKESREKIQERLSKCEFTWWQNVTMWWALRGIDLKHKAEIVRKLQLKIAKASEESYTKLAVEAGV